MEVAGARSAHRGSAAPSDVTGAAADHRELLPEDLLALYSAPTLDRFVEQTFRTLPRVISCDYVSVFYERAGDGFLTERDSRGRVWDGAFMQRYIELTPAIPLVVANPGMKVVPTRFSLTVPEPELHRMPFYREVMQPQGWRHAVALCFWAKSSAAFPIFVLSLYRIAGEPDFDDPELANLETLHPFFAAAVTRFHEIAVSHTLATGAAATRSEPALGVVFTDRRGSENRIVAPSSVLSRLTGSEREVALVVAEGLSNQEAAERLGKTVHAVKFLLHRAYRKLGTPNRSRLSLLLRGRALE